MMNKPLEELVMRKELLHARSALYRLKIRHELLSISDSLHCAKTEVATAFGVRSILFGFALQHMGHSRVARLLSLAGRVMLFAKVAGVAIKLCRKPPAA